MGGARHDLLVMTTTYGITVGARRREVGSSGVHAAQLRRLAGRAQITTATRSPIPPRAYVYAASPDGRIRKLACATAARSVGRWPASLTRDPTHEKIASSLNLAGRFVLATTGGYIGDAPPYQGKVVAIDRATGPGRARLQLALLEPAPRDRAVELPAPRTPRSGAAPAPSSTRQPTASSRPSNGPFDGSTELGRLRARADARRGALPRHYTPGRAGAVRAQRLDLGSTSPALLPRRAAAGARRSCSRAARTPSCG